MPTTFHTSRKNRWRPYPLKKRLRGHRLTIATERMLFDLLAKAVQAHCLENGIERMSSKDADALRKKWTAEALKVDVAPSWIDGLGNEDVDLLKHYLIWQADRRCEEKYADYATAAEDGRRRRLIKKIWDNATIIRMLQWLTSHDAGRDQLLTERGINDYVESVCQDQRATGHWRVLLLPFLEDQIVITLEERKRSLLGKMIEMRIVYVEKGLIFIDRTDPPEELSAFIKHGIETYPVRSPENGIPF